MRLLRNNRARLIIVTLLLGMIILSSCKQNILFPSPSMGGAGNIPLQDVVKNRFTADEDKIAVFENSNIDGFWARNDRGNGQPFNCSFSNQNAVITTLPSATKLQKRNLTRSWQNASVWKPKPSPSVVCFLS